MLCSFSATNPWMMSLVGPSKSSLMQVVRLDGLDWTGQSGVCSPLNVYQVDFRENCRANRKSLVANKWVLEVILTLPLAKELFSVFLFIRFLTKIHQKSDWSINEDKKRLGRVSNSVFHIKYTPSTSAIILAIFGIVNMKTIYGFLNICMYRSTIYDIKKSVMNFIKDNRGQVMIKKQQWFTSSNSTCVLNDDHYLEAQEVCK